MVAVKRNIDQTREAGMFLTAFIKAAKDLLASGKKLSLTTILLSIPKFLPAIALAEPAWEGHNEIPAELKDLDKNEKAEIKAMFAELTLNDPKKEHQIERMFGSMVEFLDALLEIVDDTVTDEDDEE